LQAELKESLPQPAARLVLGELQRMDEERVAGALREAAVKPDDAIADETVSALFETLSYHSLLDDVEACLLLHPSSLMLQRKEIPFNSYAKRKSGDTLID
jgi:hypothetical protein